MYDYDEAYYASVVKDTISSGNFLTLQKFESAWFEKPPLLFWLTMASVKIMGENEFAMRFPTAALGVVTIWGTYLLTYLLTRNFWAALGAGSVLLFSGLFPAAARQFRPDVPLTAALIFAVFSFVKGWEQKQWFGGFWIFTALGALFKSILGLFSLPIVLIFSTVYRRWAWMRSTYFWFGFLLFFILVLPWHLYEGLHLGRDFWQIYFLRHVLQRAGSAIIGGDVTNWDYLKHLLILNEPWFIITIVVALLIFVFRRRKSSEFYCAVASIFAAIFIGLVFGIAKTKLVFYLVPLLPFEAIAIASGILFLYRSSRLKTTRSIWVSLMILAAIGGILSTTYQIFISNIPYSYPWVREEKYVGELIRENYRGHALYSFDWRAYDTIYYYSGQNRIQLVEKEDLKNGFSPPYFMIMPRPYLKNTKQDNIKVIFAGTYLVLLEGSVDFH